MLTETLSGKCPCCGYDKMLQRYGSLGYYQMDGCPKCGLGYGTNQHEIESFGVEAWIDYGRHILACVDNEKFVEEFEDDKEVVRTECGYKTNGGQTKEDKAYNKVFEIAKELSDLDARRKIFEWSEKQERSDDVEGTIFAYTKEDIEKYLSTKPVIF